MSLTLKQNTPVSNTYTVPYYTPYPSSCLPLAFNKYLYVSYIHRMFKEVSFFMSPCSGLQPRSFTEEFVIKDYVDCMITKLKQTEVQIKYCVLTILDHFIINFKFFKCTLLSTNKTNS